ncbi:MAG: SMP-30/gluconolactonase/LRE family protein [Chloroflexi bacterium]|nr:SMP-30/gluconolactonase/LRE family protein [Chloroflexota bacterium]
MTTDGADPRPDALADPPRHLTAGLAWSAQAEIAESPRWDEQRGELLWVDTMRGIVSAWDPHTGGSRSVALGQPVGSVVLTRSGIILAAVRDGFGRVDRTHGLRLIRAVEQDQPDMRMNDGACDPQGRFWAGTMELGAAPGRGSLYRLRHDLVIDRMLDGVSCSNGIGWSPDGRRMYYIDTPLRRIDVFRFDGVAGTLSERTTWVSIEPSAGAPDGLTVDDEGGVWVALWGGGAVRRYAPDGRLDMVVETGTPIVTSCTFGGDALDVLFITTGSVGDGAGDGVGGSILQVVPGVRGRPANRFAGI